MVASVRLVLCYRLIVLQITFEAPPGMKQNLLRT